MTILEISHKRKVPIDTDKLIILQDNIPNRE